MPPHPARRELGVAGEANLVQATTNHDCPRRRTLVAVNMYDHGIGASYCVAVVRVINLCDELPGKSP